MLFRSGLGIGTTSPSEKLTVVGETTSGSGTYGTKLTYSNGNQSGIIDTFGNHNLEFRANNDRAMNIATNGDISFYEDTGTTAKLFWDASAEQLLLGITATAAGGSLVAKTDSNGYGIAIEENSGSERWSLGVDVDGDLNFINSADTTPTVTFNDAGNVGIGVTSPTQKLYVKQSGASTIVGIFESVSSGSYLSLEDSTTTTNSVRVGAIGNNFVARAGGSERMRIDSSGNVGIGTSSPSEKLHVNGNIILPYGNAYKGVGTANDEILKMSFTSGVGDILNISPAGNSATGEIALKTTVGSSITERMRITSTGSVGIGTNSPSAGYILDARGWGNFQHPTGDSLVKIQTGNNTGTSLLYFSDSDSVFSGSIAYLHTDDAMRFNTNATERMRIDSSGRLNMMSSAGASPVLYHGNDLTSTSPTTNLSFGNEQNGALLIYTNSTERLRIDSSGNLLVGTTSSGISSSSTVTGIDLKPNSASAIVRSGGTTLYLNRLTDDGEILALRKNGITVGSIGSRASAVSYMVLDPRSASNGGVGIGTTAQAIVPTDYAGANVNGTKDLGNASYKWKDLYLAGTANFGSLSDGTITITGFVDQDDMSSDSATLLPTQQSVKAYVDANSFTINNNADNRIITGTATAGTLNAETTLTYGTTGADLAITGGSIGSVPPILRLEDVGSSGKLAELNHITGTTTLTSRNATSNGVIKFAGHNGTSETEYARITATGELLLNKTSASVGTDGVQLRPSSYSGFSATSTTALFVNRNTNDGDVVEIGKNGVKVGSIGTRATYLTMGTGDVGLMFNSGSNRIQPENVTTGAITSGLVDLGYSGGRFKDLYLSGTGYFGSTTSLYEGAGGDAFFKNTNAGADLFLDSGRRIRFTANGSERMRIDSSGRVGIGTSSPASKLSTVGTIRAEGMSTITGGGKGTEIRYDTSNDYGGILSYDRGTSTYKELRVEGSIIKFKESGTDVMTIDGGNVGIGTTSPAGNLQVYTSANRFQSLTGAAADLEIVSDNNTNPVALIKGTGGADLLNVFDNTTEVFTILDGGNIGIGTDSPARKLEVNAGSASMVAQFKSTLTSSFVCFANSSSTADQVRIGSNGTALTLSTNYAERMRIDSSGNLLVGKTSSSTGVAGARFSANGFSNVTRDGGECFNLNRLTSDGTIIDFRKDSATVGSIGTASSMLYIGNASGLRFDDTVNRILPYNAETPTTTDAVIDLGSSGARFKDLYLSNNIKAHGDSSPTLDLKDTTNNCNLLAYAQNSTANIGTYSNHPLIFDTNSSERMRIDSSGRLIVGGTTAGETGATTIYPNGNIASASITATGDGVFNFFKTETFNPVLTANDSQSDTGQIIAVQIGGTTKGNIGINSATGNDMYIASGTTSSAGVGLRFIDYQVTNIQPCRGNGSTLDNVVDLGSVGARFDDIYATNGTIQTSDENEKQDIQALTDAEQRVATACKGLIRRFRWQDSVAEKDDNPDSDETARYHFGVIAQDLQDAFTAEGLNASDYGMFISSTWEDDNGVEQTRLGVRYNELLAFIITTL